ncbi:MAG: HdeD family acid-resistance protein [Fusicatenibacter sp.]
MRQFFKDLKNSFLLSAVVSIILGIVLIVYPVKTSLMICYIAGILLIFCGVVALIRYFSAKDQPFFYRYDLFIGLVLILAGFFVVFQSDLVIAFIPVVIGLIILINGLMSLQKAFHLKRSGFGHWWIEFLLALLTSVLGLIICMNPFDAIATTNIFIGICLIYSGLSDLYTTYSMGKIRRSLREAIRDEVSHDEILREDDVIDVEEDELH